jgi:hypothetical protein
MAFIFRYYNGLAAQEPAQEVMGAVRNIEDFSRVMQNNQIKLAAQDQAMRKVQSLLQINQQRLQIYYDRKRWEAEQQDRLARREEMRIQAITKLAEENRLTARDRRDYELDLRKYNLDKWRFEEDSFNKIYDFQEKAFTRTTELRKEQNLYRSVGGQPATGDAPPAGYAIQFDSSGKPWYVQTKSQRILDDFRARTQAYYEAKDAAGYGPDAEAATRKQLQARYDYTNKTYTNWEGTVAALDKDLENRSRNRYNPAQIADLTRKRAAAQEQVDLYRSQLESLQSQINPLTPDPGAPSPLYVPTTDEIIGQDF